MRIEGNNMNDNQELKDENSNNYVDPRNINAEVIGELRKDKIGKPVLVVEIFLLFAIVLIALPIVSNMLNDENSFLYKMIYGSSVNVNIPNPSSNSEYADGSAIQPLALSTKMKYENIVMQNFSLTSNSVKCEIYSYNGQINLDEKEYYLEIYSSSNSLIASAKLVGMLDVDITEIELKTNNLRFNNDYNYFAKIVSMSDDDYPEITLSTDESGIGSITCSLNNQNIEYIFKNGYLIRINDKLKVNLTDYTDQEYLNIKGKYDDKVKNFAGLAKLEEVNDGFIFSANIDLEVPDYTIPDSIADNNYYKMDTEAKIVHYAQTGKGFDCK